MIKGVWVRNGVYEALVFTFFLVGLTKKKGKEDLGKRLAQILAPVFNSIYLLSFEELRKVWCVHEKKFILPNFILRILKNTILEYTFFVYLPF